MTPPPIATTPSTPILTLSLHDALPISDAYRLGLARHQVHLDAAGVRVEDSPVRKAARLEVGPQLPVDNAQHVQVEDRKSTRLYSSHLVISYAVFCLKKKTLLQENENNR